MNKLIALAFVFQTSISFSQSVVEGTLVYHHSSKLVEAGFVDLDTVSLDSLVLKRKFIPDAYIIEDGHFRISAVRNGKYNLRFIISGCEPACYRDLIIKNISLNDDTVNIKMIPVFYSDDLIIEMLLVARKSFFGLRKRMELTEKVLGTPGPFSEIKTICLDCIGRDGIKLGLILFEEKSGKIFVDWDDLKKCDKVSWSN